MITPNRQQRTPRPGTLSRSEMQIIFRSVGMAHHKSMCDHIRSLKRRHPSWLTFIGFTPENRSAVFITRNGHDVEEPVVC